MVQVSFLPPLSSARPREILGPGALSSRCIFLIYSTHTIAISSALILND